MNKRTTATAYSLHLVVTALVNSFGVSRLGDLFVDGCGYAQVYFPTDVEIAVRRNEARADPVPEVVSASDFPLASQNVEVVRASHVPVSSRKVLLVLGATLNVSLEGNDSPFAFPPGTVNRLFEKWQPASNHPTLCATSGNATP